MDGLDFPHPLSEMWAKIELELPCTGQSDEHLQPPRTQNENHWFNHIWTSCFGVRRIGGEGPLSWGSAFTKMGRFESFNHPLPAHPKCKLNRLLPFQLET
jgi:hypothetical protein